jgi:predicted Zn-dependent peptidase
MNSVLAAVAFAPQLITFGNGLPVIVDYDPDSPFVTLVSLSRCDDQSPDRLLALEIACRAIMRETQTFSTQRLQYLSWLVGGRVEAELAGDTVRIEITTAPSHFSLAATLLSELTQRASFSQEALAEASRDLEKDLERRELMPWYPSIREFRGELGIGPRGPIQMRTDVTRALWQHVVRPDRTAIAIVGGVSPSDVERRLTSSFGLWELDPAPGFRIPRGQFGPNPVRRHAVVMASVEGPPVTSNRFAAWLVFCGAMGWGTGSALHRVIRNELGWAYQTGCSVSFRHEKSHAIFHFSFVRTPSFGEREQSLKEMLASAERTISKSDVDRAKSLQIGQYLVGSGGPEGIVPFGQGHVAIWDRAFWLAWWQLRGGFERDSSFKEEIANVAHEDVKREASLAAATIKSKVH